MACGMKRILIVTNTLGRGGAETALLALLRCLDPRKYSVSLYVLTNQGELVRELPEYIHLVNWHYTDTSVLTRAGRRQIALQTLRAMLTRGTVFRLIPYLCGNLMDMLRRRNFRMDKLLWRVLSDEGQRPRLEERIRRLGLEEDFLLLGAVTNPYPLLASGRSLCPRQPL